MSTSEDSRIGKLPVPRDFKPTLSGMKRRGFPVSVLWGMTCLALLVGVALVVTVNLALFFLTN